MIINVIFIKITYTKEANMYYPCLLLSNIQFLSLRWIIPGDLPVDKSRRSCHASETNQTSSNHITRYPSANHQTSDPTSHQTSDPASNKTSYSTSHATTSKSCGFATCEQQPHSHYQGDKVLSQVVQETVRLEVWRNSERKHVHMSCWIQQILYWKVRRYVSKPYIFNYQYNWV